MKLELWLDHSPKVGYFIYYWRNSGFISPFPRPSLRLPRNVQVMSYAAAVGGCVSLRHRPGRVPRSQLEGNARFLWGGTKNMKGGPPAQGLQQNPDSVPVFRTQAEEGEIDVS